MPEATRRTFDRVATLLREMPWLWGAKQYWSAEDSIEIGAIKVDFLNLEMPRDPISPGRRSSCFIHLQTDFEDEVTQIFVKGGDLTWFDLIRALHNQGIDLKNLKHVVALAHGFTHVYRPTHGLTFAELYKNHWRYGKTPTAS